MTDQEERSEKMSRQKDKRAAEEAVRLTEDEARRKARSVKELKIAEDLKAKTGKESDRRTAGEPGQQAKEDARRKAYSEREVKLAADLKAREIRD